MEQLEKIPAQGIKYNLGNSKFTDSKKEFKNYLEKEKKAISNFRKYNFEWKQEKHEQDLQEYTLMNYSL